MSDIKLPIVVFDQQHSLFFLSLSHAISYLKCSQIDQMVICDANGQILSFEGDSSDRLNRPQLELSENHYICKRILVDKFDYLLQNCDLSTEWLNQLSANQLITLACDSV